MCLPPVVLPLKVNNKTTLSNTTTQKTSTTTTTKTTAPRENQAAPNKARKHTNENPPRENRPPLVQFPVSDAAEGLFDTLPPSAAPIPTATRALLKGIQDPVQQQAFPTEETWEDFADAVTELAAEAVGPQSSAFQHGHAATPSVAGPVPVGNLTGADFIRWTATAAPTTLPLISGLGLKPATRQEHRRLLNHLRTWMLGFEREPLAIAVVKAVLRRRTSQKWRWSSTLKTMAAAQGACTLMPMYHTGAPTFHLGHCVVWKQSMRAIARKAREELPNQPLAVTWKQVSTALRSAKCLVTFSAILLAWATAARVGCVTQLNTKEVVLDPAGTMSVTFSKGKGASMRCQTYTVHTKIDTEFLPRFQRWLTERAQFPHLFPGGTDWGIKVREHLRTINPLLEQRSLRRGSLQALAEAPGMTDAILLLFSGHASVLTLRRYLNYGRKAAHTKKEMQQAMGTSLQC
jgi:integrase